MAGSSNQQVVKIVNVNAEIMKNVTINHNYPTASTSTSSGNVDIDYCPAPVSTFSGRSGDLASLKTLFTQCQVVALVGMGGLGKTQLSRRYVLVNKADYKYKYWLESETPEKLQNSFKSFARKLHVDSDNIGEVVNDVYKKIQAVPTILVFDNVEKAADVYDYLPTRVDLPPGVTIHVLVTSRLADWTCDKRIVCYKLQPLDVSDSLKIFEEKFGETCTEAMQDKWEELAEMLGHLPLALQVATSSIYKLNKQNFDLGKLLTDYMKQLREGARKLLKDPLPAYNSRSVYTSMMLTLKQLENNTDDEWKFAVTLINTAAYMDPDGIAKEYLLKLLDNDDNTCILDEALVILTEFSLFNQGVTWGGNNIYTVHRIIQTSIRHNHTVKGTADRYYTRALKYALAETYCSRDVFQYANDRASAVICYYKENPSPRLLKYLVQHHAITAVQGIFELMTKEQIQSLVNEQDLLYWAVDSGGLSMTQLLCNHGADINQLSRAAGMPPLNCALKWRNMEIAKWLLQKGATSTVRDRQGRTALHAASWAANHEIVSSIIQTDRATVHATDNEGNTPLLTIGDSYKEAAILSTIHVLVENGADITRGNKRGDTVLHSAARGAYPAAVTLILQLNKHLINIVNEDGQTVLHVIRYDDTDMDDERILATTRALVESGVDLTKVDVRGNTVLHSAARGARAATVALILQLDKHLINIVNEDGQTALHVIPYDDTDIDDERILATTLALVESGADLTKVDVRGNTVLHSAARGACAATVALILQLNKDLINIVNNRGQTALHVIRYDSIFINGRTLSTIRVLVESGVDLTKVDVESNTVLHSAARGACAVAVVFILQLNKELINIVNNRGQTALHVLPYISIFKNEGILATIPVLVESGVDLTKVDVEGDTVLHSAARVACAAAVALILHLNKDLINIRNGYGHTALHVLSNSTSTNKTSRYFDGFKESAQVLIMNGLSLDTRDNEGRTPLDIVLPEYKDTLLQIADDCNNQLLVSAVNQQRTE